MNHKIDMGGRSSREVSLQTLTEGIIAFRNRWDSTNVTFHNDEVRLGNEIMSFGDYSRLMGPNNATLRRDTYLQRSGFLSRLWESSYRYLRPTVTVDLTPKYEQINVRTFNQGEMRGFSSHIPGDLQELSEAIIEKVRLLSMVMEGTLINVVLRYTTADGKPFFRSIPGASKMDPEALQLRLRNMDTVLESIAGSDAQVSTSHLDASYFEISRILPPKGSGLDTNDTRITTIGHFIVLATPSKGDDCLFHALDVPECSIVSIRAHLGIQGPMPVTPKVMQYLETVVRKPIDVLDPNISTKIVPNDLRRRLPINNFRATVVEEYHYIYQSSDPNPDRYQIILSNVSGTYHFYRVIRKVEVDYCPITGRYPHPINLAVTIHYLLEQDRLDRTEDVDDLLEILRFNSGPSKWTRIAYDVETVVGKDGKLVPYLMAYRIEDRVIKYFTGPRCLDEFANVLKYMDNILLIGFNSMRFDNHLLLEAFINVDVKCRVTLGGTNIIDISWGRNNHCLDLYKFVGMSLRDACTEFGIALSKGDLDHEMVQRLYERNGGRVPVTEEMIEYNKQDVKCTYQLYTTLEEVFLQRGLEIHKYCTLGQMAYRHWRETLGTKIKSLVKVKTPYAVYVAARKSLYGGISAVWDGGVKDGTIAVVDCVSLYPFVMMEYDYPFGVPQWVTSEVRGTMGIYLCDILGQNRPVVIPRRSEKESLDWEFQGPQMGVWLNTVDIESIRNDGGIVTVYQGWIWPNNGRIFRNWLQTWKQLKMEQDELKGKEGFNACLRTIAKNMQNVLSGKIAQRAYETESMLSTNGGDIIHFVQTHRDTYLTRLGDNYLMLEGTKKAWPTKDQEDDHDIFIRCHPAWLASFVYAYSRRHMRDRLLKKYRGYITETDSYMVPMEEYRRMKESPGLIGSQYGQFKLEGLWKGGIFVAKKCYHLGPGDSSERKARFKGIGFKDRVVLQNNVERVMTGDQNTLKQLYDRGIEGLPRDMYLQMARGGKVWIICRHIRRGVGSLHDLYTLKECIPDKWTTDGDED